jgi:ubiquitin-protein ligase
MWHPNVDFPTGEVCAIRSSFGPTKKLTDIGMQLAEYLNKPDPKEPTNAEAAAEFANDIAKFEATARSKQAV